MDSKIKIGSLTTIGSSAFGGMVGVEVETQQTIMFYIQIFAFAVSIVVGICTVIYTVKKIKQLNKSDENK